MNYIKQLNAFKDFLEFNEIPSGASLFWHTLMMINNMAGWKRSFNASNILVNQYSGLSKQRLSEARAVLVKQGLIHYEKGVKGRAPVYEIISLVSVQGGTLVFNQTGVPKESPVVTSNGSTANLAINHSTEVPAKQDVNQGLKPRMELAFQSNADQSRTIHKQKQNQKRGRGQTPYYSFSFYEQNFTVLRPAAREVLVKWCEDAGDKIVLEAMKLAVMHGGRTLRYIEQILKEWSRSGLISLEEVREYEKQKAAKRERKRSVPFWRREKTEKKSLFDDLRKEALI